MRLVRVDVTCEQHRDDGAGQRRPVLLWRFDRPMRAISSGVLGGGIRACAWVLNAEVALSYGRLDPAQHLRDIAAELALTVTRGTGMLTAASVSDFASASDHGSRCEATVGLSFPVWAAGPATEPPPAVRWRPGTINLVCTVPVALCDAALVNAVLTTTEAKSQALIEAGVPGTGTASDAVVICCPTADGTTEPEQFCGPRSVWGARLARSVHSAVSEGVASYAARKRHASDTM
jgi:adenosylcobinamide hydrolase